jgi:(p)ppGpp synthase/HD superfamily hydrolase
MSKSLRKYIKHVILETIELDIEAGDVILTGKFKNKRKVVKDIGTDEYGHPTINGVSILKIKIEKLLPKNKWSAKSKEEANETIKYIRKILIEKIQAEDFEDVMQTAQLAHLGQKRRDGSDYIMHPVAVQKITKKHYPENFAAQILAVLHDTIEDGPSQGNVTEEELRQTIRGSITDPMDLERIEIALDFMTHDKTAQPNYEDYLEGVFSNRLAAIVKMSDLIHNLSHNPSERQVHKYKTALQNVQIPGYIAQSQIDELMKILG